MVQDVVESSNELNDASKDRDIASNTERDRTSDQSTTDFSQDVDTQERIRSNAVAYDHAKLQAELENQRRDRTYMDQLQQNTLTHMQNMQAIVLQGMQNMVANAQRTEGQHVRHVDHTLIDLHGSDVNPGAGPGAPTTDEG